MPSPELDILTGVKFTSWTECPILITRKIVDATLPGIEVEVFDASEQGTVDAAQKIAADIPTVGPLELTVQHKQDDDIYSEVNNTGTLVLALPHTGSSLSFTAIFQSYKPQNTPFNQPMLADVVIEISGKITPTAGA